MRWGVFYPEKDDESLDEVHVAPCLHGRPLPGHTLSRTCGCHPLIEDLRDGQRLVVHDMVH